MLSVCEKIVVRKGLIDISIRDAKNREAGVITLPWAAAPHYRKREVFAAVEAGQHEATRPIRAEARSPVTSRSNCANESSTLRVTRPMLVVVLNA